jgi:PhnB protein
MALHPYLFFSGTAGEAMTRYQEVLGGTLEIMAASELPEGEDPGMEMAPDAVMHGALVLDDGTMIMGSDDPTGDGAGVKGIALHLSFEDLAEVEPVFWSPLFGACVDRFGVSWMLSGEMEAEG